MNAHELLAFVYILLTYLCVLTGNEIDGKTLTGLTELMIAELVPVIKYRVKFVAALKALKMALHKPETDAGSSRSSTVPCDSDSDMEASHSDTDVNDNGSSL